MTKHKSLTSETPPAWDWVYLVLPLALFLVFAAFGGACVFTFWLGKLLL